MVVPLLSLIQSFHEMSHACQALSCDSLTIWGRGEGLGLGVPYDMWVTIRVIHDTFDVVLSILLWL